MTPTISIILPTTSRATLVHALNSLQLQEWKPGDELILVGDGPQKEAKQLFDWYRFPGVYIEIANGPLGSWGHAARNWVLDHHIPKGGVLCALDDDDRFDVNHFKTVRKAAERNPDRLLMFRMRVGEIVLWKDQEIRVKNVGTPMLIMPNDGKWGRYGVDHEGDYDFISQTAALHDDPVIWREEVIYHVRPTA